LPRLSGRRGGQGRGDRGWAKTAPPDVGHDPGRLKSRGWRRAFTLRSQIHSCLPPPSDLPPGPLPRWCVSSGAGKGPGRDARDMRERFGTALAHEPRTSRPGPHRLQTFALASGIRAFLSAAFPLHARIHRKRRTPPRALLDDIPAVAITLVHRRTRCRSR
jgi:hypothetical protein